MTATFRAVQARADLLPQGEILLPGLWKRLHDEGVFEMFFHDFPELTFGQFVQVLSNPTERMDVIVEQDEAGNIIDTVGLSLLTQIVEKPEMKRGVGNFLLFRKYWDGKASLEIGDTILANWFDHLGMDVIAGVTPKMNHAALKYIHRLGFQSVGEIPDFCLYRGQRCPAVVSHMSRVEWRVKNG
jgi:RimJ/RimL family protein N-acetyltransferase